jgi:hypothetical protein
LNSTGFCAARIQRKSVSIPSDNPLGESLTCNLTLFSTHPGYTGIHLLIDRRDCSPRMWQPVWALESVNEWLLKITRSISDFNRCEEHGFPMLDPEYLRDWVQEPRRIIYNPWWNQSTAKLCRKPYRSITLSFIEHADGRRETGYQTFDFDSISMLIFRAMAPVEAEDVTGLFYKRFTRADVIESEKDASHMRKPNIISHGVWACRIGQCTCNQWASTRNGVQPAATWAYTYLRSQDAMQEKRQVHRDPQTLGEVTYYTAKSADENEQAVSVWDGEDHGEEFAIKSNCLGRKTWCKSAIPSRPHANNTFPIRKEWTWKLNEDGKLVPVKGTRWGRINPKWEQPKKHSRQERKLWARKWHHVAVDWMPWEPIHKPAHSLWVRKWRKCVMDRIDWEPPARVTLKKLYSDKSLIDRPEQVRWLHDWYSELQNRAVHNKNLLPSLRHKSNGQLHPSAQSYLTIPHWPPRKPPQSVKVWDVDGKPVDAKKWVERRVRKGVDKKRSKEKSRKSVSASIDAVVSHFSNS